MQEMEETPEFDPWDRKVILGGPLSQYTAVLIKGSLDTDIPPRRTSCEDGIRVMPQKPRGGQRWGGREDGPRSLPLALRENPLTPGSQAWALRT